jgi:hypothetical protein
MSIVTSLLQKVEENMPKVISPRAHGVIDYAHAAVFLYAGVRFLRGNKKAGVAALVTGGFLLTEALLTDYPLGVTPRISFKAHGEMDSAFVAAAMAAPKTLGFASEPAAWFFRGNAIAEALIVGMTDFSSRRAHAEREGGTWPSPQAEPAA